MFNFRKRNDGMIIEFQLRGCSLDKVEKMWSELSPKKIMEDLKETGTCSLTSNVLEMVANIKKTESGNVVVAFGEIVDEKIKVVKHYCSKEEYLEEIAKQRLTLENVRNGKKPFKVWDIVDEKYLDVGVQVLINKEGFIENLGCVEYSDEGTLTYKELKPISRYRVEEWVIGKE